MKTRISAVFLAFTLAGFAQENCSVKLEGSVLDEHNNEPLGFASIFISNYQQSALTDANGNFVFEGLCPGVLYLEIAHLACETYYDTLQIQSNTTQKFFLEHHVEFLEEIHVVDQHNTMHAHLDETMVMENQGKDLALQLKGIPGVSVQENGVGVSKPMIQGLGGNRIVVSSSGVAQENQQWGQDHGLSLDPLNADNIKVVKGPSVVLYGAQSVGGAIVIEHDNLQGHRGWDNTILMGYESNGKQGLGAYKLTGRLNDHWVLKQSLFFRQSGNKKSPNYYLSNSAGVNASASTVLLYHKNRWVNEFEVSFWHQSQGILRESHIGNLTDLERAWERGRPIQDPGFSYQIGLPNQWNQHVNIRAKFKYQFQRFLLEYQYAFQNNNREEYDQHVDEARPDIKMSLWTNQNDIRVVYAPSSKFNLKYGGFLNNQSNQSFARPLIPNYLSWEVGQYALAVYRLDRWTLEAGPRMGVRMLDNFINRNGEVSYQRKTDSYLNIILGTLYRQEAWWWRQSFGLVNRLPHPSEWYSFGVHHGSAQFEIGNPFLEPEKLISYRNEIDVVKGNMHFKGEAFFNHFPSYIAQVAGDEPLLTIQGAFPVVEYQSVRLNMFGFNGLFDYQWTSHISQTVALNYLDGSGEGESEVSWSWSPNQVLHRLQYKFLGEKAYVAIQSEWNQARNQPDFGMNLQQPESFDLHHLYLGYQWLWATLQIRVENIFDTSYRNYMNRLWMYAEEPGRTMSIQLKINL